MHVHLILNVFQSHITLCHYTTALFCRLKTFDSGVMVLQLQSHDEDQVIHLTTQLVSQPLLSHYKNPLYHWVFLNNHLKYCTDTCKTAKEQWWASFKCIGMV